MANPGTILNGRFRLDRLVGQGGFAQVFLSTDLVLDRQVAVKVLRPDQIEDTDTAPFLERFGAEARLIARLEHPNVLGLYDYGQSDGLTYLVMPYVAGGSLHDLRRTVGRLTPAQAAGYLRQVAAALDYAHANNIVHRDIKPQNMLLRSGGDHLLVADFGIAKVLREDSTQSGTAVIGSAAYMAPEQFQGRVGRPTDIYALGCVAFELLTGTPPYPGPAERSMFGHIYGELPRLDATLPDASPALQAVIDRALAKLPEARYPSAGAFADAFAAAISGAGRAVATRDEQPTRRIEPPAISQPIPMAAPPAAPETRPLPPAPSPPTAALPAAASTETPPRSLVPWLAVGIVTLLVLLGISAAIFASRRSGNEANLDADPKATVTVGTSAALPSAVPAVATSGARPTATAPATTASTRPTAATGLTPRSSIRLTGHTDWVGFTAWSPDGEFLATASEDNTARVWRKDGSLVHVLTGQTEAVRSLAWSPDSMRLATGSNDGSVLIWEQGAELPVARYGGEGYGISGMAWSRDGSFLVIANDELRVLQTDSWQEVANLGPGNGATILAWSPDEMLAVGADEGSLRLFAADGALVADMVGHTAQVTGIAWSPKGDRLVSAGGNLLLWDAQSGQRLAAIDGHTNAVMSVAWSPDGQVFASGAKDRTVRLWNAEGRAVSTLPSHEDEVMQVAWLRDGTLVSGDNASTLRWWSATGTLLGQEKATGCGVYHLAASPVDNALVVAQLCDPVEIWR